MLKIQQKVTFYVGDQEFPTMAAAQEYMDSIDPAKLRLEAFVQHMRDTGAQRITSTVRDTVRAFIAFEDGEHLVEDEEPVSDPKPTALDDTDDKPPFDMDDAVEEEVVDQQEDTAAVDGAEPVVEESALLSGLDSGSEEEVAEETQEASNTNAKVNDLFGGDSLAAKEEPKNLFG